MGFFNSKKEKTHTEFSKALLIQESTLMWIVTLACVLLAFVCVFLGFTGTLPWISAMIGLPWGAYGVSQAFYYKKSEKENTQGGIKFESVMADINANLPSNINIPTTETSVSNDGVSEVTIFD